MNNRIYQSPDVYTVLSNRLVRALPLTRLRVLTQSVNLKIADDAVRAAIVTRHPAHLSARFHISHRIRLARR